MSKFKCKVQPKADMWWVSAVQFFIICIIIVCIIIIVCFFFASWATVIGQERHPVPVNTIRISFEFRSTYLCFCPGSSYLPRSIWNASRTEPPGIVYFPPTNLLQASGLCPFPSEYLGTHKWSHRRMVIFHNSISLVIWHLRHSTKH